MKRVLLLTIAVVVALCGGATDRFYIEDFAIAPGETRAVSILLDNEATYTAFQCDLCLPGGLTATDFALTSRKSSNHTFTSTVLSNGVIRLLSYSLKIKAYSGNSGALVTFNVTAADDFTGPATIAVRNILFTTVEGDEIPFSNETCTVTQTATTLRGDVDGDGTVGISDVTDLIDYILSGNATGINVDAADCDQDSVVGVGDVTTLIDYILSGSW